MNEISRKRLFLPTICVQKLGRMHINVNFLSFKADTDIINSDFQINKNCVKEFILV